MMHPSRRQRLKQILALDPATAWHQIYRQITLSEFPGETRLGFQLAFYRPLAVPRMAKVLLDTGHMQFDTTRRAYDTALVMHEIIYHDLDHPRSQKMVRLMNGLHARPDVLQADLTHVLNSLIVVPTRFIARAGWRPLTPSELTATWRFWTELGERMHINSRPTSYEEANEQFDAYESAELASSRAGAQLTAATLRALDERLPRLLKGHGATITSALLADTRFSDALGLPPPRCAASFLVNGGLHARRLIQRATRPSARPTFTPGQAAGSAYPRGYSLDELGPRTNHS